MVEYKYDAWGKPLSTTGTLAGTLGKLNPFRYRGYVYDEETGLYYLRSRYYSHSIRRFICPDNYILSGGRFCGCNQYKYCSNNVIRKTDNSGCREIDALSVQAESSDSRSISCGIQNRIAQGKAIASQINKLAGRSVVSGGEIRSYAINKIESGVEKDIKRNLRANGLKTLMMVNMGYGVYIAYANNSYGTLKRILCSYESYKLEMDDEIIQGMIRVYEFYDTISTATDIISGKILTENDMVLMEAEGSIMNSIFYGFIDWITNIELPPDLATRHVTLVAGKNDPYIPGNWLFLG